MIDINEENNFDAEVEELSDKIYRDLKKKVKGFDEKTKRVFVSSIGIG